MLSAVIQIGNERKGSIHCLDSRNCGFLDCDRRWTLRVAFRQKKILRKGARLEGPAKHHAARVESALPADQSAPDFGPPIERAPQDVQR